MEKIKLHIGCGYNKLKGYINIDMDTKCDPDIVMDVDSDWKQIKSNSVDYIKADFVLEHVEYKNFFKQVDRVLKKGGIASICVPSGLDFTNFQDPTHIHAYMPNSIQHLTKYEHKHYNSDAYIGWNLKHVKTTLLFRSYLSKFLYYAFMATCVPDRFLPLGRDEQGCKNSR